MCQEGRTEPGAWYEKGSLQEWMLKGNIYFQNQWKKEPNTGLRAWAPAFSKGNHIGVHRSMGLLQMFSVFPSENMFLFGGMVSIPPKPAWSAGVGRVSELGSFA